MKRTFFYGWVVVFACMLLAAAATGMLSYLNPLFITTVTEDLGISRASFMVYQTFSTVATVITMPLLSSFARKLPMKPMIIVGAILCAGTHFCYSMAEEVWMFYLGGFLGGVGTCLAGSIPIAALTSNWFHEKKGTATGLAFAGTGASTALLSPVISRVIAEYGWRMGYRLIAVLILAVIIPAVLFLIRVTPAEMGLLPYGMKPVGGAKAEKQGLSRKQIFKTRSFWLFCLAVFLQGCVTSPAQQQLVAYWTGAGNDAAFAAAMYSLLMTVAIFTKIFLGSVYDHTSITKGTLTVGSLAVASYLCLLALPRGIAVAVPAVLFGVTVSVQVLVSTYVANRLFGDKEYAFVYGIMTPMLYGGVAVGSPVVAGVYDRFGSYVPVWCACALVFAAAVALIVLCDRLSRGEYRRMLGVERK